jgi:hypothetical protein
MHIHKDLGLDATVRIATAAEFRKCRVDANGGVHKRIVMMSGIRGYRAKRRLIGSLIS